MVVGQAFTTARPAGFAFWVWKEGWIEKSVWKRNYVGYHFPLHGTLVIPVLFHTCASFLGLVCLFLLAGDFLLLTPVDVAWTPLKGSKAASKSLLETASGESSVGQIIYYYIVSKAKCWAWDARYQFKRGCDWVFVWKTCLFLQLGHLPLEFFSWCLVLAT